MITITGQISEPTPGSFVLTVTTVHLGDEWTSNGSHLKATNWADAHTEASRAVACLRAAILGETLLLDHEEDYNGGPQAEANPTPADHTQAI
jgi:hypothetical protein